MNSTDGELQGFPRSDEGVQIMHVNMDVSQYKRVACLHVDIQHAFHRLYVILLQMWGFMEKGTCDQIGDRRLDSCFHERQWTSCFFCDAGFGPIAQSHPNRFWIECVSTGLF